MGLEQAVTYLVDSGAPIWAVLFISLLGWVLKTNNDRERRYIDTIERLSESFGELKGIKESLGRIERHLMKGDC